jgi:hypothetical protein
MPLRKGSYEVLVRYQVQPLSQSGQQQVASHIEVRIGDGSEPLGRMAMANLSGEHTLTIPFRLERSYRRAQTRVWFAGTGILLVRDVTFIRIDG